MTRTARKTSRLAIAALIAAWIVPAALIVVCISTLS
jgi:hypothetical protein